MNTCTTYTYEQTPEGLVETRSTERTPDSGPYYRWPSGMFERLGGPWEVYRYRPMPCTPAGDLVSTFVTKEEADMEVDRLNSEARS